VYCLFLASGGSFQSGSRFVVHDRGKYTLTRMRVSTAFPFHLVRAVRYFTQEDSLMVWPALGVLKADLFQRGAADVSDSAPSQVGSGSDEFFGLREYCQGDNPRWIHWKRSAALAAPVVKEMSRPRPDVLYVILDTQLTSDSPDERPLREKMIRLAATLVEQAFRREYRVGLATAYSTRTVWLNAGAGIGQRVDILDAMACIDDNRLVSLSRVVTAIPARMLQFAQVVVIAPSPERLRGLAALRACCQHVRVITADELDAVYQDDLPAEPSQQPEPPGGKPA
jgi:uncharacterized protein (DUF58 family)